MSKKFLEVFPTLQIKAEQRAILQDILVEKISTNRQKEFLKVFLFGTHIIPKREIYQLEEEIQKQLFYRRRIRVHIEEKYELSSQYTPDIIMETYMDSLLEEIGRISTIARNMLKNATINFEGNVLCLSLPEGIVAEGKKTELAEFLEKVFGDRFQMPVEVRIVYEKRKSRLREESEHRLQREIKAIVEQSAAVEKRKEEETETPAEKPEKKKKPERKFYRRESASSKDMIYGRDFEGEVWVLSQVNQELGEVIIRGQVIKCETREIRNEKSIVMVTLTDFTDSIVVKMFIKNEQLPDVIEGMKAGSFLKVKGIATLDKYDREIGITSVTGVKRIPDFRESRKDLALEKRVELHCHTKMSDMDGVSDVKEILKRAHDWGHKAVAITDHGVVQAFPEANHFIERLDKEDPFKVIYGVEGYLVDDLKDVAVGSKGQDLKGTFVVFDLETTGFSPIRDKIIEIGAVKVENGKIIDTFSTFVNPKIPIPFQITNLTGIKDHMVIEAPDIYTVLPRFLEFVRDAVLVAHNAAFDVSFIEQNCRYQELEFDFTSVDTVGMARILLPDLSKYKLNVVAKALNISLENHHRAVDDAMATAEIFIRFLAMLEEKEVHDLDKLNQFGASHSGSIKKLPSHHVILLAQNEEGRVNLYRLISKSHLEYFHRWPRIPKSELSRHRKGILVGSACEAGEVFQALLNERSDEKLAKLVSFYDYLEIQPLGNNRFMIDSERISSVTCEEDLRNLNRRIVELGEKFQKPVVATGDVHFMDPSDEVYRKIIMAGKGFQDAEDQPPLYFRTTEEMLEEFRYLGAEKAREVVIENPNKIADTVEKISPVRPDKCPPVIPDSDKELRKICYEKAHQMYGEELPKIVVERLERELKSIISNGFAVMYIIAQKLVWKSNEDGYLVGSRGSVGSSFVATMAGITEVNPLSPHYYCPECYYSDFESEEVRAYAGGCGWDMPDKKCPRCGAWLKKDGFDIPFETFLGFKGNKEPDIDLNFSGDYQSNAHKYTEVIFGTGQTYRAGTIGTLADKTAFGYVKNYYEEKGEVKRNCEIDRIVQGCTGVRRSTGQHPGGIIVLPLGEEIHSFTPVQHPANDMNTDIITTHFDYHSIDHNLLKLDILGHDDPTMIKTLEEYISSDALENEFDEKENPFDATKIPLDDKSVMSLFHDTSALGIKPDDIGGCPVGCLGIPEFGTDFVIQMVVDTKPQTLSDLIRISGLSHGTDVWLNNAQELIRTKKATISTAICTRDDIMTYLINQGMDSELSFTIMEAVRKGKGIPNGAEEKMREADVPEWYIWSCNKIKYMFPKAHAAAYVMMAYRIAYCKIHYPLAYYGAYFGIRASAFSYELMCQGQEALLHHLEEYRKRGKDLTNKEQDTVKDMKVVQEMYARGFGFEPIDIYRAKAHRFLILDGKLMPPLSSIEGMGEKAAEAVEEASKNGKYLSRDDFRQRTKVSKTVVDTMVELGILEGLPESNQLSLFDF